MAYPIHLFGCVCNRLKLIAERLQMNFLSKDSKNILALGI
jgi:hypothetical protein